MKKKKGMRIQKKEKNNKHQSIFIITKNINK
jgi:hypothetical protein